MGSGKYSLRKMDRDTIETKNKKDIMQNQYYLERHENEWNSEIRTAFYSGI